MALNFGANGDWWHADDDMMHKIAINLRCPQIGDSAMVGDVVSIGIEPGEPYGRILGFPDDDGFGNVVVQAWKIGDDLVPTGEVRRGALGIAYCGWYSATEYGAPEHASDEPTPIEDDSWLDVVADAISFTGVRHDQQTRAWQLAQARNAIMAYKAWQEEHSNDGK